MINVENADLNQLNLVRFRFYFKGDVIVQVSGNSIENLQGNVYQKKPLIKIIKTPIILMILT
jgi:hypothetical protein